MPTIKATDGDTTGLVPAGQVLRSFVTPIINLLAAGATYNFNTPLVPGRRLRTLNITSLNVVSRTGAAVGNIVATLAQNGVSIQNANSNYTAANTNGINAPQRVAGSVNAVINIDMTTYPLQMTIVTPSTGPSVFTGYFEIWATYE